MVNDEWDWIRNFETESCFSLGTTLGGRRDSLQTLQDRPPQKCTKCEKYNFVCFLLSFWSIGGTIFRLCKTGLPKNVQNVRNIIVCFFVFFLVNC